MNLYLVQHGEPLTKDIDPERPLSERGRQEIAKLAQFAAKNCRIDAAFICHSGKLRARQTAEILASGLKLPDPQEADNLAPLDDPAIWLSRLEGRSESIMLVGHLPHLAKLAGALLCGGPEATPIKFRMGGLVALAREERQWALQWMIVPEMVAG